MKKINFISTILFFNYSIFLYPRVNQYVNYMWGLNLDFSWKLLILYNLLIISTLGIFNTKKVSIKYLELILLFGIVMPIFAISTNTGNYIYESILIFTSYIISILSIHFFLRIRIPIKKQLKISWFKNIIYSVLITSIASILVKTGFNFSLDITSTFNNIYLIREKGNVSGLNSYMTGWLAFLFITISLSDYFEKNKRLYLAFACIIALLLFQTFAIKSHFLTLFLLLFFGIMAKRSRTIKINPVILFYFIIFLLSSLSLKSFSPFLDRFFYLPGMLNAHYIDFFNEHSLNYFNLSKLSIFFNIENYNIPVGYIIDNYYYGGKGMNANTGSFASIYSEIGILGLLIILPILIGITVSALSRLETKFYYFSILLVVNLGFLMINSPFNDLFLTHGLFLPLILTPLIKANK